MPHTEKIKVVDGIVIKYICEPCPECRGKLELFDRYKRTLENLTPGGSEYVNDPERCAVAIRDRFAGPITILKRQRAKLEAAEEMAKALKLAVKNLSYEFVTIPLGDGPVSQVVKAAQAALSGWDKAGGVE